MKISELQEGLNAQNLECYIGAVSEKVTKKGGTYVNVTFKDETGEISANIWDTSAADFGFPVDTVVKISGTVSSFAGKLQINVTTTLLCDRALSSFFRSSEFNIANMHLTLKEQFIDTIQNPVIKFLLNELVTGNTFREQFCKAPAAKGVHHAWIGGLLEHVLGMCNIAKTVYENHYKLYFPTLDMEKVYFGCIMHDWGKIYEYSYNTPNIGYTKAGALQHHMGIVAEMMTRLTVKFENTFEASKAELSAHRDTVRELVHIIYSHHGKPEWGSMVRPATAEALFVHLVDYMDGNMIHMRECIKDRIDGDIPGMSKKSWVHQSQYLFLPEEKPF